MINNFPFDNHIKDEFEHYSPDVPPHIWENIIAKREKRKPVGFWMLFFRNRLNLSIIAVLVLSGSIFLARGVFEKKDNNSIALTTHNESTLPADKKSPNTDKVSTTADNVNNPSISSSPSANNKAGNIDNATSSTGNSNKPLHNTQSYSSVNKDQNNDPDVSNTASTTHYISKEITKGTTHKKSSGRSSDITLSAGPVPENILKTSLAGNSGKNEVLKDNTASTQKNNNRHKRRNTGSSLTMTISNGETGTDETEKEISPADKYFTLNRMLLDIGASSFVRSPQPSTLITKEFNKLNIPCPEAEKNSAGNKRYFEIYGGPDYAFRQFSDTANSNYLKRRKESTSFRSAFSAGLRYTRVFKNGVSIRAGINYSQINEKFNYAQGNIVQTTYIIGANGDTTGVTTVNGIRYKTTYNKFRTLDIPLSVGYELGNGRFHANFNAGIVINVYSWQKGDVLDTSYQPVSITTGKSSSPYQFKTNVGVGFMGGISFYYKLNERMHLLAEPYFRYNLSPASKAELTLKQKYTTVGLRLGLRIDF